MTPAPMGSAPTGDGGSLAGFTIAITAARRRAEFGAALEQRGALVVYAPAVRIVAPDGDLELRDVTLRCLDQPLDIVVGTTSRGFRAWLDAAGALGLGATLRTQLSSCEVVARGPKLGAVLRVAGLNGVWSPASESSSEMLAHLLARDLTGKRIAVQLHGEPLPDLVDALRQAGAEVIELRVFRWALPDNDVPLRRLVAAVAAGQVDAVAFTSGSAAVSFLRMAAAEGLVDDVLRSLRAGIVVACVGGVTAAPFQRADVPVLMPNRPRLGALVREIAEQVPARRARTVVAAGHRIELRGHLAVLDGVPVPVGPVAMALLRELARHPGEVVSRADLLAALPGSDLDEREVAAQVAALRAALGDSRTVQAIGCRGYRLAYEPEGAAGCAHDPGRG
jgi:uroporphyrinogen-III synthase